MAWDTSDRLNGLPPDWAATRQRVFRRDNRRCQISSARCTRFATEVDHIDDPGDHSMGNLRSACRSCHSSRSSQQGHAAKAALRAKRFRPTGRHPGRTT